MIRAAGRLLVVFALACAGCDSKKPAPVEPPDPGAPPGPSSLAMLGIDAAVLGEPLDPPAPAGDLASELERFVNLERCVSERAKLDPLIGDALGAIGYDTFLRDACRLLEATKDERRETCDRIDSSALRARCRAWVAMAARTPDACPMVIEGLVTRGRDASCVAVAARDPRLCAGEPRAAQRVTCSALVARDPGKCDVLMPGQRALCAREVARWRTVLSPPLEGLDPLPAARGRLAVRGAAGTPDPPTTEADLAQDFARGVVVVTARDRRGTESEPRMRVELGTLVESDVARIAASPQKRPRVGVAVVVEPGGKDGPGAVLQKLELVLPGEAPIVSPPSSCDCKLTGVRAGAVRGAPVSFVLEGRLSSGARSYEVTLDVATFVRDVAKEAVGSHVLPPLRRARDGG